MDVSDLAKVIGYEVDSLLEAINQAGLSQSSANDNISTEDRKKILEHIKSTMVLLICSRIFFLSSVEILSLADD